MNTHLSGQHKNFPAFIDPVSGKPLSIQLIQGKQYYSDQNTGHAAKYPIIDSIPRLLTTPENYTDAFGEQWLRWRSTQLDSHSGITITRDRLYRCLGERGKMMLSDERNPVQVLEVGCGAGRFTEVLLKFPAAHVTSLEFPAAHVTSLDFSNAVEANQLNFPQNEKHRIVQADIMHAPFQKEQFDMVICLGVIQHTPDPEETISVLFDHVRPGGMMIVDHYRPELRRLTKVTANFLRPIIKRLPSSKRMRLVEVLVGIFFPVHRAIRNIPFAQQIFSRISPITTYFHVYPKLSEFLQKEWSLLDTHDGLTDWYKHLRTPKQIHSVLEQIGGVSINVNLGGNGVEASCIKR